ncbi:Fic family protein [bacterium]|nr:Fic family protein [bacterium]
MFDKNKPHNNLPILPPKTEVESKKILKKAISANRALASMASYCKQLPKESIFYNTLFLKEAKESSEIENIVTTNDELYQALSAGQIISNPNTREVMHYTNALWEGMRLINKNKILTSRAFIKIVNTIKENNEGVRKNPGVKIANKTTGRVIYTPPEGENIILEKLKNLEKYINNKDDIDPLIKMAIIHYQFEAIHPFSDGNGRTGRIINILYLVLTELLEHPMLFLSKYIIDNKDEYYVKLREVTEKDRWEDWILYMLNGVEETSIYMKKKVSDIISLMLKTKHEIRNRVPKIYSKDLLEILFQQPYSKIKSLENAGIAKRLTATKYLNELEKLGILQSVKVGKEKLYVNIDFFKLLKE